MPEINIATEDELSETVACRLIQEIIPRYAISQKLRRGGFGYLRARLPNFCQMARRVPVLLLTDLDKTTCAPALISHWCDGIAVPQNLIFRVAVREIESWIIADQIGFSAFLGISAAKLPVDPDALPDPKQFLLHVAKGARREIKNELLPTRGAIASQGLGYNRALCNFVLDSWSMARAAENSQSLARAVSRIGELP